LKTLNTIIMKTRRKIAGQVALLKAEDTGAK
jgi:hypothetical protein